MELSQAQMISSSLVREYLSRGGLVQTLAVMDEECPRQKDSISNRQKLSKALNAEDIMKKNLAYSTPLRSILEAVVYHILKNPSLLKQSPVLSNESDLSTNIDVFPLNHPKLQNSVNQMKNNGINDIFETSADSSDDLVFGEGEMKVSSPPYINNDFDKKCSRPFKKLGGPISSNLYDGRRTYIKQRNPSSSSAGQFHVDAFIKNDNMNKQKDVTNASDCIEKRYVNEDFFKNDNLNKQKDVTNASDLIEKRYVNEDFFKNVESKFHDVDSSSDDLKSPGIPKKNQYVPNKNRLKDNNGLCSNYDVESSSITKDTPSRISNNVPKQQKINNKKENDIKPKVDFNDIDIMQDIDADLDELNRLPSTPYAFSCSPNKIKGNSVPIEINTAKELKTLILGDARKKYNNEWLRQGFSFNENEGLKYGFVQKKGGPCGILAAVQAEVLLKLLFAEEKVASFQSMNPSPKERSQVLAEALAEIFWRAGEHKKAVVVIPRIKPNFTGNSQYSCDGITETLYISNFHTFESLGSYLMQVIHQFENDGGPGVILCLYSAILSRTIKSVVTDLDEPKSTMMGMHMYCSQNMVNLINCGRAVSNVFNGVVEFNGSGNDKMILKGISERSHVGLLSLFEFYKSCKVGTHLKVPKFPIWVVCSESHFSVLFSMKKELMNDWRAERHFDLYYYDGLGQQNEVIKLSVSTTNSYFSPSTGDLVPPLELCIRTKWPNAEICWNGTDPLL